MCETDGKLLTNKEKQQTVPPTDSGKLWTTIEPTH